MFTRPCMGDDGCVDGSACTHMCGARLGSRACQCVDAGAPAQWWFADSLCNTRLHTHVHPYLLACALPDMMALKATSKFWFVSVAAAAAFVCCGLSVHALEMKAASAGTGLGAKEERRHSEGRATPGRVAPPSRQRSTPNTDDELTRSAAASRRRLRHAAV